MNASHISHSEKLLREHEMKQWAGERGISNEEREAFFAGWDRVFAILTAPSCDTPTEGDAR